MASFLLLTTTFTPYTLEPYIAQLVKEKLNISPKHNRQNFTEKTSQNKSPSEFKAPEAYKEILPRMLRSF